VRFRGDKYKTENVSSDFNIRFPQSNTIIVGGEVPVDAHSGYLRRRAAVFRIVDLDVFVVDFPQQTIQFLFVLPISVEHQRDDGQYQQQCSGDDRQYFRGMR